MSKKIAVYLSKEDLINIHCALSVTAEVFPEGDNDKEELEKLIERIDEELKTFGDQYE